MDTIKNYPHYLKRTELTKYLNKKGIIPLGKRNPGKCIKINKIIHAEIVDKNNPRHPRYFSGDIRTKGYDDITFIYILFEAEYNKISNSRRNVSLNEKSYKEFIRKNKINSILR